MDLYLHCSGSGSPTVILEAGYNDISETWSLVQPEVARFTHVCAYDRAGLGQSDPVTEDRDSYQVVNELHSLLLDAEIDGPYVLAGHSLGGVYVRLYADQYPEDVAGLVLVDSSHKDQIERCAAVLPPESPDDSQALIYYRDWLSTNTLFSDMPRKIFEPGSLGDKMLVVIYSPEKDRGTDFPAGVSEEWDRIWIELQEEWGLISSRSTQIVADESGHYIQLDQPDLVIEAIYRVVEDARGDSQ